MTDSDLLQRYSRDGSEEAFTELVNRYVNLVFSAAFRQCGGDKQLAEDVTQTVFCDLARKAGKLLEYQALSGWLYTSTRYAASRQVRSLQRRTTQEQKAFSMQEN